MAHVIGAVVFDVGECLVDESREYGTWADWLGVPRHVFSAMFGAVIARGQDYRETFQVFQPGFDLAKARQQRADEGKPEWFGEDALREHLAAFVKDEPGALVFPGQMGGPLRRGNFNKMSGWPHAVRAIGMESLHFHDLRHAGNHLAAASGAGLKNLMARMGHDSERAALTYQARGADKRITDAIDVHVQAEHGKGDDEDGAAGTLVPAG